VSLVNDEGTEANADSGHRTYRAGSEAESGLLAVALRLIEQGRFADAAALLTPAAAEDPSGKAHALLALAHFRLERYGEAARHYALASERDPGNEDWRAMRARATANSHAAVQESVPDVRYFDRDTLLAPALADPSDLPDSAPVPQPLFARRVLLGLGHVPGLIIGWLTRGVTESWGRLAGYHDEVWTNWYRRNLFFGLLTLAYMRDKLFRDNLKNVYPEGVLTGFQRAYAPAPRAVHQFRTANGSWNNPDDPMEGAAGTRFGRNVNAAAIRPETGEALLRPNPRYLSLELLSRGNSMKEVPFLNLLAASWIQFQVHDWVSHGENLVWPNVHEIPLPDTDPARHLYRQTRMFVGKTQPDPTRTGAGEPAPVTFINEVTHWWDGSQVYGSDWHTLKRLRRGEDGKLGLGADGLLPAGRKGIEDTGFVRNWWIGLTMFHTLFAREHNAICDRLKSRHPHWEDDRLFHTARLINAAVMAKIHTVEWTPAMLPDAAATTALHANWFGLATTVLRRDKHRRTRAALNIPHPEIGGVVGNPCIKHGVPFSLSEEFVEIYRLHSLLPESLLIRRHGSGEVCEEIPLAATRQAGSSKLTRRIAMTDLFYSFANQHPGQLVLNNYPRFMQQMSIPGNPLFDLGAADILRARERGIPRYNAFRRQLGLRPIRRFEDLSDDAALVAKLRKVYGERPEDVELLDLLIGTLAEGHRPPSFGFGETLFQIFILNATRRLQADRFYTDCYDEAHYTKEGLDWIDDADLKTVLLRHYPELAHTGLANVRNAFEPWDTDEVLDLERHPLRRFDPALQPDPERGEAWR
jgi:tetratricopeptide (TPR) repeat protein